MGNVPIDISLLRKIVDLYEVYVGVLTSTFLFNSADPRTSVKITDLDKAPDKTNAHVNVDRATPDEL